MESNMLNLFIFENDGTDFKEIKKGLDKAFTYGKQDREIAFFPDDDEFEKTFDCISHILKTRRLDDFLKERINNIDCFIIDMELLDKQKHSGLKLHKFLKNCIFTTVEMPPSLFISKHDQPLSVIKNNQPPNTAWAPKSMNNERFGELAMDNMFEKIIGLIDNSQKRGPNV